MTPAVLRVPDLGRDPPDAYPFPVAVDDRWQGGAITDTLAKAWILCGQRHTVADVEAAVCVTLTPEAYAQWGAESTTPADRCWPTLWGRVRVEVGCINAVWVPLMWLPRGRLRAPTRGSVSVAMRKEFPDENGD